jgi:4-diphosphocytidyl-2-C-methyl-D-erythritol kinase
MKMNKLKILAPAKINLHLQITSKRSDGFHNLISLFQMVSLYDEIFIEKIKDNCIILNGNFDCSTEENLIYRAALWVKTTFNLNSGFFIDCKKNIPVGAGLGGGSSDAAATITGIISLMKLKINNELLNAGALSLGSDVPFFLGSATAVVLGRGEHLIPVKTRKSLYILITDTGINSSTREVFNILETGLSKNIVMSVQDITNVYENLNPSEWQFDNTFNPFLIKKYPIYEEIISILKSEGSDFSSITGTGSSVFGVFTKEINANNAQKVLKNSNIMTHKVKMLAIRPEPVYN